MTKKWGVFGFIGFFAAVAWAQPAGLTDVNAPDAVVTLEVQVVNGTQGGRDVAGDTAVVQVYDHMTQLDRFEATVSPDGRAVFEALPAGPRIMAVPRVRHGQMMFGSPAVLLSADGNDIVTAQVTVYEVSTDVNALSVGMHHLVLEQQGDHFQCTEIFVLTNDSDTAVSSDRLDAQGRPQVLRVDLPAGAEQLMPMMYLNRAALVTTDEGFYDTMAVPPGTHQVGFTYQVPLGPEPREFIKAFTLPTAQFVLIRKGQTVALDGLGSPSRVSADSQGVPLEQYQRTALVPGDELRFQVAGVAAMPAGGGADRLTWVILAAVFAAVVLIVLVRLVGTRSPGASQS